MDQEDKAALEFKEKPAIVFDNNGNNDNVNNNTNEQNTFDYNRLPATNLNHSNESAPALFEYESDEAENNDEKEQ